MLSNQIIQSCMDQLKNITKTEFAIMDSFARTIVSGEGLNVI